VQVRKLIDALLGDTFLREAHTFALTLALEKMSSPDDYEVDPWSLSVRG